MIEDMFKALVGEGALLGRYTSRSWSSSSLGRLSRHPRNGEPTREWLLRTSQGVGLSWLIDGYTVLGKNKESKEKKLKKKYYMMLGSDVQEVTGRWQAIWWWRSGNCITMASHLMIENPLYTRLGGVERFALQIENTFRDLVGEDTSLGRYTSRSWSFSSLGSLTSQPHNGEY